MRNPTVAEVRTADRLNIAVETVIRVFDTWEEETEQFIRERIKSRKKPHGKGH